jgi:peptidoglycan/xylan/chitin deacetylase (PgdA/CDA1 family)
VSKPHQLTLSFDDGFRDSFTRIAEIHERHGLAACLNVMALGDRPELFAGHANDVQVGFAKGDFALWNRLAARGHEIMPHGLVHENYAQLPLAEAKRSTQRCLEIFARELQGFDARRAVFNFPYNSSTPELEAWLPGEVRAFRSGGTGVNPLPRRSLTRLSTTGRGPDGTEADCERAIGELLARESGWLIYNLHGLDGEGWGPVRAEWLDEQLARLRRIPSLAIMPAARALAAADAAGA